MPVARYLDRFGFRVFEAANAANAVGLLTRHHPAVILSGLRGAQAALFYDRLSDPASDPSAPAPSVVVVLVSSIDDPVPTEATGVLTKPFSLRPMLDELRRALRTAGARETGRETVKKRARPRKDSLSS